jgi:hypothetical protein
MFVEVIGGNQSQKKHVHKMVEFCVKTLMPKMNNLDITVNLTTPKGAMGYCCETDDNRTFEIEADKSQSLRNLLETVAHEMVHVKQYARRELHPDKHVWMGKTVNPDDVNYWDQPWEIEAHGRQLGLFIRYCEENNLSKHKWTQVQ